MRGTVILQENNNLEMQALCKVPAETSNIYFSLLPICFTKEGLQKLEEAVNRKCALHSISLNAEQDQQRDQIYICISEPQIN